MIHILGVSFLALFFFNELLSFVWQLKEDLDLQKENTKLQHDELERMQRWILNQRYGDPGNPVVLLPANNIISKIPPKEEPLAFTFPLVPGPTLMRDVDSDEE